MPRHRTAIIPKSNTAKSRKKTTKYGIAPTSGRRNITVSAHCGKIRARLTLSVNLGVVRQDTESGHCWISVCLRIAMAHATEIGIFEDFHGRNLDGSA